MTRRRRRKVLPLDRNAEAAPALAGDPHDQLADAVTQRTCAGRTATG